MISGEVLITGEFLNIVFYFFSLVSILDAKSAI